jgi:hypothetical protein
MKRFSPSSHLKWYVYIYLSSIIWPADPLSLCLLLSLPVPWTLPDATIGRCDATPPEICGSRRCEHPVDLFGSVQGVCVRREHEAGGRSDAPAGCQGESGRIVF